MVSRRDPHVHQLLLCLRLERAVQSANGLATPSRCARVSKWQESMGRLQMQPRLARYGRPTQSSATTTRLSIYSALTLLCSPEQAQEEPGSYASGEETEPLAFGAQLAREAEREAER